MGLLGKSSTVADAERALADAEALVARFTSESIAADAEHASLAARAGDEALDAPASAARIADELGRLANVKTVAEAAVAAASRRVEGARRDVLKARAADLRGRAARLRTTVAVREKKTARLLDELRRHEGCEFVPHRPVPSPGVVTTVVVPWSHLARGAADGLDRAAADLERVAESGAAELVAGALRRGPVEVKPVERLTESGVLQPA
jgi:hypothetical protein